MPTDRAPRAVAAECVLPAGRDLEAAVRFFVDELGFRLDAIAPADNPACAQLSGHGLNVALDRTCQGDPGTLRLRTAGSESRAAAAAPNGTRIEFVPADPPLEIPPAVPLASVRRCESPDSTWTRGRAGMLYRDLVPDRAGGYLVASHIRIPDGGPVPDNVHFHDIHFQFIYCCRGWVRLVYEDQDDPFVMQAGDCVLQPPHIRHRVLEASPGLEVVEVACPASHMTRIDHDMTLPTGRHLPRRDYRGQAFAFHQAGQAGWQRLPEAGLEARDLGLEAATHGRVRARVLRRTAGTAMKSGACDIRGHGAFVLLFVLRGSADATLDAITETRLGPGGTCLVPGHSRARLRQCDADLELLEVSCPG